LLAKIDYTVAIYEGLSVLDIRVLTAYLKALRAVVELHKPKEGVWWISNPNLLACSVCEETLWDSAEPMLYPCPTIQKIMDQLK